MWTLHHSYPRTIHGLGNWAFSAILWGFGFALFIGRSKLPPFIGFVASNCLITLGFTTFLVGLVQFTGRNTKNVFNFSLLINVSALFYLMWFVFIQPSFLQRAWFMQSAILAIFIYIYLVLIKNYRRSFAWHYMLGIWGVMILIWLYRGVSLYQGNLTEDFQNNHSYAQFLTIIMAPLACTLGFLGCVITASEELHKQLENKSRFDSLTNCLARGSILEEIQKEILRSTRQKSNFALMMMDLDNFKTINDTLGHAHGDRILVDFSNCVSETIRQIDRLGRLGGDEFLVLLPDTTLETAHAVADRIYAAGNRKDQLAWQVSIGISVWGGETDSLEQLMERADQALYLEKSKRKGN